MIHDLPNPQHRTLPSLLAAMGLSLASMAWIYAIHDYAVGATDLDMAGVSTTVEKKARFFDFLRPVVEIENRRIEAQRNRLMRARQTGRDADWVATLAQHYGLQWGEDKDYARLLNRVDQVPLELILVQAANESNWGTSRFARQANNLFGQWCYTPGCGLVPKRRDAGRGHEVQAFDSVNASVRSYLNNLNTGRAYAQLRNMRQRLRQSGRALDAHALAEGLKGYSERGEDYVREIQAMIRANAALIQRAAE